MPVKAANVILWGSTIAAVSWDQDRDIAAFEYTPQFQQSGIELAPITMPLGPDIYSFPGLAKQSFYGLPGLLADALPDKFGNLLIDEWLIRSGRDRGSFTPVERLCYVGARGMGALEFEPAIRREADRSVPIDVAALVELAAEALAQKQQLDTRFTGEGHHDLEAMRDILRVGTSAGGARAKAVIAWNQATGEVRSGQVQAPPGFGYWLLKFDGVSGNRDKELDDAQGFGRIEYVYHLMARAAGVEMTECRLFEEHDRSHFMTKRFDRGDDGEKVFLQSLCALGHYDFNQAGAYSYEQALQLTQELGLEVGQREQLFRRVVFNILARNQDDHTKNIAFLMDRSGVWRLAPAFDVTYSYNPRGRWTSQHQMSLGGKRNGFAIEDFRVVADRFRLFRGKRLDRLLQQVDAAVAKWPEFADQAGVAEKRIEKIGRNLRRLDDLGRG
jgi:serine/threonine-protein kinase HipA